MTVYIRNAPTVLSVVLMVTLFGIVYPAFAAGGCPNNNEHPATAADLAAMSAAGIPNPVVGMCWDPSNTYVGADPAEAKQYLRGILCSNSSYGGAGPDGTVKGLDAKFSVCAASFLKAATQSGIPVCLREGYRTPAQQEKYADEYRRGGGIACTKGARCEHPRGIAIDVNTNSDANYRRLHSLGPSFGLTFYLGFRDKVHFVPMKGGCNSGGNLPPGQTVPSSTYDFPQLSTQSQATPFSGVTDSIRQALGMQSQSPQATESKPTSSQTAPASQTNQQICTPQYSCSGDVMYYHTSSCTKEPYQLCENGCNGNICALPSPQPPPPPVSSLITTQTQTKATSTIDLINAFANPQPSSPTGTSAPLVLVVRGEDAAILEGSAQTPASSTVLSDTYQLVPPTSQQTFVSTDLSHSPVSSFPSQQSSTFQTTLGNLKNMVLQALEYLKPFGGNVIPPNREIRD